jgi:hypothetical protein
VKQGVGPDYFFAGAAAASDAPSRFVMSAKRFALLS